MDECEQNGQRVAVAWSTSAKTSLTEGQARAVAYLDKITHLMASVLPPTYDQSSLVFAIDVSWLLICVRPPIDFSDGIEYGSGSMSAPVQGREKAVEEAAEAEVREDKWIDYVVNITPFCGGGNQEGGGKVGGFTYDGELGGRDDYRFTGPINPGQDWGSAPGLAESSTKHAEPGTVSASLWEVLDGDGELALVFTALAEIG